MKPRIYRLSEEKPRCRRVLSAAATPPLSGKQTSWVTITRTGSFTDPRYGPFEITSPMLLSMVKNFDEQVVGQEIYIDVNHKPGDGAAAKILKLRVEGTRLRALAEWTDYGLKAVRERGFTYLSAEFADNWQDNEGGAFHGPTLLGAGLTVRPVIKRLDPIMLSCESGGDTLILAELADDLMKKARANMDKLKEFLKKLAESGYSAKVQAQVKKLAEAAVDENTGEEKATAVIAELEGMAKTLAAAEDDGKKAAAPAAAATPTAPTAAPAQAAAPAKTLSEDELEALVAKKLAEAEQAKAQQAQAREANEKLLAEEIGKAEGLSDELKKELSEGAKALLADHATEAQVKQLAQHQINMGNRMAAASSLAAMGYSVAGSPHITVPDEGAKQLSQIYQDKLKQSTLSGSLNFTDKDSPFAQKVLSEFDRIFARELNAERKLLAGGEMDMNRSQLPYGVQREVIRQSLHDLNVLQLVQTLTDFSAQQTTQIPFEERDLAPVYNDGMVFEGQPIPFAGVSQKMDLAYINQMKLALSVTNEVVHFTRASVINWDALGRNIETNARILRELVARRLINEIQRASDSYAAVAITDESVTPNATSGIFKTAKFPVVRPHQNLTLQGAAVGEAENPITIKIGATVVKAYDGTNAQPAGDYFRIVDLNQGIFQLVNQLGAPKAGATGVKISYSQATNIVLFNLDVASGNTLEKHLNGLLREVGAAKASMSGQRYEHVDYLLMSPVLNDTISNAEQFVVSLKRNGSDTTGGGDLMKIKDIPAYSTNAPHTDMGDGRIIMGVRGNTSYTVAKPFSTGDLFEITNAQGQPLGKKVAYGEEYNAIHTPKPVRHRSISVVVYSKTSRDAI